MGQAKQRGTFEQRKEQSIATKGPKEPRMSAADRNSIINGIILEEFGEILGIASDKETPRRPYHSESISLLSANGNESDNESQS